MASSGRLGNKVELATSVADKPDLLIRDFFPTEIPEGDDSDLESVETKIPINLADENFLIGDETSEELDEMDLPISSEETSVLHPDSSDNHQHHDFSLSTLYSPYSKNCSTLAKGTQLIIMLYE